MNCTQRLPAYLPNQFLQRPLSLLTAILAIGVILFALYERIQGQMYLQGLNWIDTFTPVMISILLLRGVLNLRDSTDLQAVSLALISALSFIFIYEAIYKLSFYVPPHRMAPDELKRVPDPNRDGTDCAGRLCLWEVSTVEAKYCFLNHLHFRLDFLAAGWFPASRQSPALLFSSNPPASFVELGLFN